VLILSSIKKHVAIKIVPLKYINIRGTVTMLNTAHRQVLSRFHTAKPTTAV
jgi:hypothetical protein